MMSEQGLEVLGAREVEHDVDLVAIRRQVVRGVVATGRRAEPARLVPIRVFHFDHGGTQVAGHHRGVGPRKDPRQVDDDEAGERARPGRGRPVS